MLDQNWDLINGPVAHEIEILNYANQVNVIEAMVRFVMHHEGTDAASARSPLNCNALRELHRTGTLLLLEQPGVYRTTPVNVVNAEGQVVYACPHATHVPDLMAEFEAGLPMMWPTASPVEIASYLLWRLNWIHPFKNGNGRTARAFAYACLCMKVGFVLPGTPTVIDQIMSNKPEYEAALRHADQTFAQFGLPDLRPMMAMVERLLVQQLSSIPSPPTAASS
jgi:Fic family protein